MLFPIALSLTLLTCAPVEARSPANVLVILADDLGVDYVGIYGEGSQPAPTPNIDALAAGGILFRNAWAYPSCSPTRAAILTGRHPFRTTVGRWIKHADNFAVGHLRGREWTLPELLDLDGGGYAHAAIGKWHVHDATFPVTVPEGNGGFDTYKGFLAGQLPDYFTWPQVDGGVEQTTTGYATTRQTDDAIAWIQAQTDPWFCYMAYTAPHIPFHVPPAGLHPQTPNTSTDRDKYRAMIEAMDLEIGRLLASLPDPANTHIIFLGDNGSVQNMAVAPFLGGKAKGTPYEGGLNVPLIYNGPATVNPGREVGALACAVDVFSTVLELAGAEQALPPWVETDGVSLAPYFSNPAQGALRTYAYAEEFTGKLWPSPLQNGHACARDGRYKLIDRMTSSDEFYDLQVDPWESNNLLTGTLSFDQWLAHAQLKNVIDVKRAPAARVVYYGAPSCAGSVGTPLNDHVGLPQFGANLVVKLTGAPPNGGAFLAYGVFHDSWLGIDLPLDLSLVGAGPDCTLSLAPTTFQYVPVNPGGQGSWVWSIPNNLALLEATVLNGWLVVDPLAPGNSLGLVSTQASAVVIGY